MKSLVFTLLSCSFFVTGYSQSIAANDSAITGAGNTEMVFYQLSTGTKTTASNTDWHLALSVQPSQFPSNTLQGASLRINEANGIKVYEIPGFTADSFNVVVDTTGYHSWLNVHDSDTLLNFGALNTGYNIPSFFYGWGAYAGPPTHNVVGTKVYLFCFPGGEMKKFMVNDLDKDTAWNVQYADLDNSNLQNVHVSKKDFLGKQYVYLDMLTQTIRDKEPLASDWDLQFLKYAGTDVMPGSTYAVLGVWINKGISSAKAEGVEVSGNNYGAYSFSTQLNAIGWNWKHYDNQNSVYVIQDSLAYFIQTKSGDVYKVIFTGYHPANGVVDFYQQLIPTTGIKEYSATHFTVFPNPVANELYIRSDISIATQEITITDMSGRVVVKTTGDVGAQTSIHTGNLANGCYLLRITDRHQQYIQRLVVNK